MKLLSKAYDIINKLEEGVGEVPPGIPSVGNVSYYSSVDEASESEWGPWIYNKLPPFTEAWMIDFSKLQDYGKDPWGIPLLVNDLNTWNIKKDDDEIEYWETYKYKPNGKFRLIVWND